MIKCSTKIILGILFFLLVINNIYAITTVYNYTGLGNKDKYCDSATCTNNTNLLIAANVIVTSRKNVFIYFNLSDIENKNYNITSAKLNLTVNQDGNSIIIPIHKITSAWSGSDNSIPTYDMNFTSYSSNANTPNNDSIDITTIINGFSNGSSTNLGFMLNGTIGGSSQTQYASFDSATFSFRPLLIVTYTSTPNSYAFYPDNNTNYSTSNNIFTCNSTDSIGLKNTTLYIWNSTGLNFTNSTTITGLINSTNLTGFLVDGTYTWNCLTFNTENNYNFDSKNKTFIIDTKAPNIIITYPINNSNYTNINLPINYTVNDTHLSNCWWTNNSGSNNYSINCGTNITGINWKQGRTNLRLYTNDTFNNNNYTDISFFIDNIGPSISIIQPTDYQQFTNNTNIKINFTRYDSGLGINSCWWSNNSGVTNRTLVNPASDNITVSEGPDGTYTTNVWCNDTLNNLGNALIHYTINANSPAINLNNPINGKWFNYSNNILFNFSISDVHQISECQLWTNTTGTWHKNQTITGVSNNSVQTNFNLLNLTNGEYNWNVWCNESNNVASWYGTNWTFGIDTIFPKISITQLTTTVNSQTISFNFSANDTNLLSCNYSIFNSSGQIDNSLSNISIPCNNLYSTTVSSYGTFNLTLFAIDKAGNMNITSASFITQQGSSGNQGNTGGGTTIKVPINATWRMETSQGGSSYEFQMTSFATKINSIYFYNDGSDPLNITVTCEGDACPFITFDKTSIGIPVGKAIATELKFTIKIPKEIDNKKYTANIKGIDQFGNSQVLTIFPVVGGLGLINAVIDKFFSYTSINGLPFQIPYILIFLISFLISLFGLYFLLFKPTKIPGGKAISFFVSIIISIIVIILL